MVDYYNCKMSGSEEEFETQPQQGMTKAELRRSNKPIMEKRRRQRINQCLDELKTLILDALKKDPSRHSKLEKADILEMTVKHLRTVQDQHLSTAVATDPAVLSKFRTGFSECATEVSRFVRHLESVDPVVKQRLVSHLNHCVNNLQQMAPFYSHYVPFMPERLYPEVKVGFQSNFQNGDENNNGSARIQIPNGVQLIPSRLPTGELALLVPQSAGISANFPFFPPAPEPSSRIRQPSAFSTVNRPHSPLLSPSTSTSSYGEESHYSSEQYAHAQSPNPQQQRPFKVPEQSPASSKSFSSSSPETQKPQISSSSDSKSPTSSFLEPKCDYHIGSAKESTIDQSTDNVCQDSASQSLRQPLSVITDKTYNRATSGPAKNQSLKRHHSDGLLVISEKRARIHEPTSSTLSSVNASSVASSSAMDDRAASSNDSSAGPSNFSGKSSTSQSTVTAANAAGSSAPNGDMWRPW